MDLTQKTSPGKLNPITCRLRMNLLPSACRRMIPSGAAHNEMIMGDLGDTGVSDAGKMMV